MVLRNTVRMLCPIYVIFLENRDRKRAEKLFVEEKQISNRKPFSEKSDI